MRHWGFNNRTVALRVSHGGSATTRVEHLGACANPDLPIAWVNSLDLFQRSKIVRDAFGAPFREVFSRLKHAERSNFERIVTPLDHLWYAQVA